MTKSEIQKLLKSVENVRVGVIGDFALDIYYSLEQNTGEYSLETGEPVFYGSSISSHLGAAGNIVNNISSLGVKDISVFGFIGDDVLGRELIYQLNQKHVNTQNLITISEGWETYAYFKPSEMKKEVSRLDFGSSNEINELQMKALLENLKSKIVNLDVLIVNQQFVNPMIDEKAINLLNDIFKENTNCKVFGDLRKDYNKLSRGTLKVNSVSISNLLGIELFDEKDSEVCINRLKEAQKLIGNPLFMTRGENGLIHIENDDITTVPGIYLTGDVDNLGLGNTCISAFAVCLGTGASVLDSLEIANLAYAIIVKRIRQTGTASPEEILKLADDSYYNYDLALAHDPRKANYKEGTEIEIVNEIPANLTIKNIIFDHDGTISSLREGWEIVMHKLMLEEICGDHLSKLPTDEYNRLSLKCEKFINDTTGIQTIVQMQGLRKVIQEEGYIPESEIKSAAEYKATYLNELMISVNERIKKYKNGERSIHDFSILGGPDILKVLAERGFNLFLASGTDEENVIIEANALGYGSMFNGGIFGSKGNEIGDAKKIVINRIIEKGNCKGENLVVIGDGPVEIIEGRRVGALCIGVASDEIRRHGINYSKRTRLIRAGAHIIIPDFSQLDQLLKIIFND